MSRQIAFGRTWFVLIITSRILIRTQQGERLLDLQIVMELSWIRISPFIKYKFKIQYVFRFYKHVRSVLIHARLLDLLRKAPRVPFDQYSFFNKSSKTLRRISRKGHARACTCICKGIISFFFFFIFNMPRAAAWVSYPSRKRLMKFNNEFSSLSSCLFNIHVIHKSSYINHKYKW